MQFLFLQFDSRKIQSCPDLYYIFLGYSWNIRYGLIFWVTHYPMIWKTKMGRFENWGKNRAVGSYQVPMGKQAVWHVVCQVACCLSWTNHIMNISFPVQSTFQVLRRSLLDYCMFMYELILRKRHLIILLQHITRNWANNE